MECCVQSVLHHPYPHPRAPFIIQSPHSRREAVAEVVDYYSFVVVAAADGDFHYWLPYLRF